MKVLHINFSKAGGAGAFARDLVEAQTAAGIDSRLINLRDSDLRSEPLRDPLLTLQAVLDQYVVKSAHFESPISLLRNGTRLQPGELNDRPDLIHLHWTEGVVSDSWLNKVTTPIVWTLHDFRPISGACHHPLGCTHLSTGCNSCPAVRPLFTKLVTKTVENRKAAGLYSRIHFVAPSKWVADIAKRSSALAGRFVPVVYNASPSIQVSSADRAWLGQKLGDSGDPIIAVAFGSSSSSLKGREFLEAIDRSAFEGYRVVAFGAENLSWADSNLGLISRERVSALFSKAVLTIIPSQAETFSLAAFESTRLGTPVCGLTGGAVQEIAEAFGEFVALDPESIREHLGRPGSRAARVIVREMSDVVNEYQAVYFDAISSYTPSKTETRHSTD